MRKPNALDTRILEFSEEVIPRDPDAPFKPKIQVWFDRPHDCLCLAHQLSPEDEGMPGHVIRIGWDDVEDFVDALFTYLTAPTLLGLDLTMSHR